MKKSATTVSYAEHADDLLLTARRAPDAPSSDQVLVLLRSGGFSLERKGGWDTLGMRGTCSPPYEISATGSAEQILPASFGDIAAQTMVPFSHILWGGVWLGIAVDAAARARALVLGEARKTPGTLPPGARSLGDLCALVQLMRHNLHAVARTYDALMGPEGQAMNDEPTRVGFAVQINNLKVSSSELVVDIVGRALAICGIAGYRNSGRLSLSRHLRDAHSARLMINNDRIRTNNATRTAEGPVTMIEAVPEKKLLAALVQHGLLIPTGVDGVLGRGRVFEEVVERFDRLGERNLRRRRRRAFVRFPPVIPRRDFERSEFLKAFPHLAGSIWSFTGDTKEHQEMIERVEAGGSYAPFQTMTDVVLTPAACYPVYPRRRRAARGGTAL